MAMVDLISFIRLGRAVTEGVAGLLLARLRVYPTLLSAPQVELN